ncbi:hypothetical protein IFM89_037691 [Coptis chinensis]|uniref:Beta-amylase n=1 Tax=Coptis chinensis TaxID=261450 RepID=A0A835IJC3_9MAGN|nr:hypothetical protein IFM89_037691 [Coptis chinensis]
MQRRRMEQEMGRFTAAISEEEEEEEGMGMKDEEEDEEEGKTSTRTPRMISVNEAMNRFQYEEQDDDEEENNNQMMGVVGGKRCRPKEEKERTKLRERQRRAITARILAGLRRHGNYNLRVRADINDVISALARQAGWVVLPDGTTFPSSTPHHHHNQGARPIPTTPSPHAAVVNNSPSSSSQLMPTTLVQSPNASFRGIVSPAVGTSSIVDYNPYRHKTVFVPNPSSSRNLAMVGDRGEIPLIESCLDGIDDKQVMDMPPKLPERDFAGTPYVPVYVMLPLGVINMKCELVDPDALMKQLRILKAVNVDGVMVDCWWGIVESHAPQVYNWSGYKQLFQIVRELKMKLQVVMSFHDCGGNVGDDVCIPLPHWVTEIGHTNPDIFFTDRDGRRNPECLTWGIDKERVLRGRTAVEVYFDYMRSFRVEFDEFFQDGVISEIEVGLGPCGELRYPSYPAKHGWRYPGIGEFQCYDQYLLKCLRKAAEARGHSFWARVPDNAGSYNSQPHDTGFFCDGGDYDSYYGRFFLNWYSQILVDHGDRVLSLAKLAFEGTCIAAKLSGIHWWYKTASHAAELTAGFYNPCNRDGYAPIASMLKKHEAALNFTCVELRTLDQHEDFPEALADPEGLVWQVLNAAWDVCIPVASENALTCHDREGYNKILENAKPMNDPDGRHLSAFTYLRLSPLLMERHNFMEFERFVKRMHGEPVLDLQT